MLSISSRGAATADILAYLEDARDGAAKRRRSLGAAGARSNFCGLPDQSDPRRRFKNRVTV